MGSRGPHRALPVGMLFMAVVVYVLLLHGLSNAQLTPVFPGRRSSTINNTQDVTLAKVGIPFGDKSNIRHYHGLTLAKRALNPVTEDQWKSIVAAGEGFFCLLRASIEGAEKLGVKQSAFTDPASLGAYGWETKRLTASGANSIPVFKELDQPVLSYDQKEWFIYEVKHSKNWATDGKRGLVSFRDVRVRPGCDQIWVMQASNGYYTTHFNNDAITPTMIATFMYSPKWVKRNNPLTVYPDLQQWSDVVFLKYLPLWLLVSPAYMIY
jgi:hypothetical protein